ncbi:uncharacterized protein Dana_GF24260, isoform C [Drosophila ananassae]|uniref:Uncharacterized protein, isoform C n=1 Tax=Drosophila ananassae TaxID=7217 RepID=A0A0P8XU64_DROAN|nr:mucin-5AC isoform X2 [Drosophila ananassae]KPU78248.1 uncharacterized protein Dana_GF24260, isoform C [Drosophila ananassae]
MRSVLLFPPVGNYRRYLIHQTCESYRQQYDLFTFSVGQGPHRRTVLCFRNQLLDPHGFEARKQQQLKEKERDKQPRDRESVKSWRSSHPPTNGSSSNNNNNNNHRRSSSASRRKITATELCKMGVKKHINEAPLSKSNSVDLYRPPALRNNSSSEEAAPLDPSSTTATRTDTTTTTATAAGTATITASSGPTSTDSREQQVDESTVSVSAEAEAAAAAATRRKRRPDRAVYVPRARRSQTTPPTSTSTSTSTTTITIATGSTPPPPASDIVAVAPTPAVENATTPVADTHSPKADDTNGQQPNPKKSRSHRERRERGRKAASEAAEKHPEAASTVLVIAGTENEAPNQQPANCDSETMSGAQRTKSGKSARNGKQQPVPPLRIEDVASARTNSNGEEAAKCDNDVRELQRASKEINRSNRRIMKQTFVSDILEIPEKIETAQPKPQNSVKPPPPADSTTEDDEEEEEDEDDWETKFDESGDCLDPKILQELSESVGKCKIELPKMDYTVFHIKQSLLNEEEFPHVLEVSNFPVEFKTPDLLMLFSQYKGSGFEIKWVDDTHALAVFSSSRIAAEVLTMGHPFVKLKPLAEATLESRLKAKKAGATSLQPYRQRPETCTALARRLVSGALGVKLPTAPQEREKERRVLREAKERKLLAAKQRDEAWES